MILLSEFLQKQWEGRDVFDILRTLKGKVYREKDGRKTFQTVIGNKSYFIKLYMGIGWKDLLTSLFRFRLPVLSAQNEWKAIQKLETLNIETMHLDGYGKRGWSPAHLQSFVITDELASTLSLENFCRNWPSLPPDLSLKRALITRVAQIARKLHNKGIIHHDFYICHFLLDVSSENKKVHDQGLHLFLIDLHRMRKKYYLQERGQIKDLAALYFSSLDIGLTQRDIFRFMRIYENTSLKSALLKKSFWRRVNQRAFSLYTKANGRQPVSFF